MQRLNEIEEFLLRNWGDVIKIKENAENLQGKVDKLCEEICKKLQNKDWWSKEFENPVYKWNDIFFWKKSWHFGRDWLDIVCFSVNAVSPNSLMGHGEDKPNACIWTKRVTKLGEGKKEKFEERFNVYAREIIKSLPSEIKLTKDPECAFIYYLPYTPEQWIEILKTGKFVDTILEHFDILAQFIEPIDKAMAEVLYKKKK